MTEYVLVPDALHHAQQALNSRKKPVADAGETILSFLTLHLRKSVVALPPEVEGAWELIRPDGE